MSRNKGYDPDTIQSYRTQMAAQGATWVMDPTDEHSDEYAHFYFIGLHEGEEVIFDVVMYTLRLQHESELFEIAEERAVAQFPDYRRISAEADTNDNSEPIDEEIGLFIAEVITELEEEETVKVKEHVDMDVNTDFGIALEVGLHREKITPADLDRFVKEFNEDTIRLDETLYSFQSDTDF